MVNDAQNLYQGAIDKIFKEAVDEIQIIVDKKEESQKSPIKLGIFNSPISAKN